MDGRSESAIVVRILIISRCSSIWSSRVRLFASTTSAGSMNTVLPDADSSCTMPWIWRLCMGGTGITSRPSRIDGTVSGSSSPCEMAFESTLRSIELTRPDIPRSRLRISARAGDALSLIEDVVSSITLSMLLDMSGEISFSPSDRLVRRG